MVLLIERDASQSYANNRSFAGLSALDHSYSRSRMNQSIEKSYKSSKGRKNHHLYKDAIIQVPYGTTRPTIVNDIKTLNYVADI